MEGRLVPCLPLPLQTENLAEIVEKSKDWALVHGACMRSKNNYSEDFIYFAPYALLPSTFPRKEFERAITLQPIINELMHKVAHDHEFLEETLRNTIKVDQFTGNLYSLYETVRNEGYGQKMNLGLIRSDYLLQSLQENIIKQVEANTIASSFGGIATHTVKLHRSNGVVACRNSIAAYSERRHKTLQNYMYVLQELGLPKMIENLPKNEALQGLSAGILDAWKIFGNKEAVVLFVIENITYNICDQRFLEFEIRKKNPIVRVIRKNLSEIGRSAKVASNKELSIGNDIVAVVYYRAGYEPSHYPTKLEWDARLLIERSSAIKCPSIHYHLAGTKKVQQALAKPGMLERFLTDDVKVKAVRQIFTGLYSLDFDKSGEEGVERALANPERYVLKPQREGGGNNVYGEAIRSAMLAMKDSQERSAWILMDRILPPVQPNYIVRPGQSVSQPQEIVCELGVFGVIIGDDKTISVNRQVGHMLRSKLSSENEGGVAAGAGALDSPYLI